MRHHRHHQHQHQHLHLHRKAARNHITMFLHLFIVNKSGGLIHHRALSPKAPQIGTNEWLRIGSTFHSLHAIATEASPLKLQGNKNAGADDGIEEIQASGMTLRCLQTRTGIKFVITAEPNTKADLGQVLREIYVLYTDCALKDPFYELEMPIRCELFAQGVDSLIKRWSGRMSSYSATTSSSINPRVVTLR
mmetsp:Transcript_102585/g.208908  ORF Transcript_102585/g.208908 Transcript_102585/m.208908 type:complete len:192 (-) Transcript_102585:3504-4079(-)